MKQPGWLWLAAVPVLAAVLYTLQRADETEAPAPVAAAELPRYTARDVALTRFDVEGIATLRGTATSVEYYDDDSGRAHDLQIDLLSDGDKPWHLTAPMGTMPAHEHRILLGDAVQAKGIWPDNSEPLTVDTTHVWVDPDTHQFETRETVHINSEGRYGSALGMRVNWEERRLQLLHNVKMTYAAAP